ncbi:hypothetical protein GQ44DRAFT_728028 [Phaeosphaeriaceae sp. PMI808]|nr:hypothetical protein GQ44DRAFT_728028 [Phaeosphaeriaceae sp. PMI808]
MDLVLGRANSFGTTRPEVTNAYNALNDTRLCHNLVPQALILVISTPLPLPSWPSSAVRLLIALNFLAHTLISVLQLDPSFGFYLIFCSQVALCAYEQISGIGRCLFATTVLKVKVRSNQIVTLVDLAYVYANNLPLHAFMYCSNVQLTSATEKEKS